MSGNRRSDLLGRAAVELIDRPGATMEQLGERLGASRATMYRHFETRQDLVEEIGRVAVARIAAAHEAVGVEATLRDGRPEVLAGCLRALLVGLASVAQEYTFVLTNRSAFEDPETAAEARALFRRDAAFFAAVQRVGLLRADLPANWVAHSVLGQVVAAREAVARGEPDSARLGDLFVSTVMGGLGPTGTDGSRA